ncbi:hypothetical protein R84B8_01802 [Treponema sp. R8-4-B8]
MNEKIENEADASAAPEEDNFELSPEEATALDGGGKPSVINRKRILIAISVFFSVLVCGGLLFNMARQKNRNNASEEGLYSANSSSSDFLDSLQSRALRNRSEAARDAQPPDAAAKEEQADEKEPLLPQASFNSRSQPEPARQQTQAPPPSGSAPQQQGSGSGAQPTHFKSSLVPQVEGRLFSQQGQYAQQSPASNAAARPPAEDYLAVSGRAAQNPYAAGASDYDAQNKQQNKESFYSSSGGSGQDGFFIGDNALWQGTVIPGVLETAVNTDLPGGVIARVTQNIYDSKTGLSLLIPQGTLLIARYNSSVSYAQRRIQIVWDTMIRPDGFQIDFGGANAVDSEGMSGMEAVYHENWFEYLKAAGIITLFSIADAKMADAAAKYASDETAGAVAASNSAFVNQVGGGIVGRAMNIQPTLTLDNGAIVNVMLNRTLYLPPAPPYRPSKKYVLE